MKATLQITPIEPTQFLGKSAGQFDKLSIAAQIQESELPFYKRLFAHIEEQLQGLPLCPDVFFEPGGALRFVFEAGVVGLRDSGSRTHRNDVPMEQKAFLTRQYTALSLIAVMGCALQLLYQHLEIRGTKSGQRVSFNLVTSDLTLYKWLQQIEGPATVNWEPRPENDPKVAGAICLKAFPSGLLQYFDRSAVEQMIAAVLPRVVGKAESVLGIGIRESIAKVMEFEAQKNSKVIDTQSPAAASVGPSTATVGAGVVAAVDKDPKQDLAPPTGPVSQILDLIKADPDFAQCCRGTKDGCEIDLTAYSKVRANVHEVVKALHIAPWFIGYKTGGSVAKFNQAVAQYLGVGL